MDEIEQEAPQELPAPKPDRVSAVLMLDDFWEKYVKNSPHSRDGKHYNQAHDLFLALRAHLHHKQDA